MLVVILIVRSEVDLVGFSDVNFFFFFTYNSMSLNCTSYNYQCVA